MNYLIDANGNNIAKIDIIDGTPKLILGDGSVDLLIKTLGEVYIDTGTKVSKLNFLYDSTTDQTQSNAIESYGSLSDLKDLSVIAENQLVYIKDGEGLYIKSDGKLILLTNRNSDKVYLSYVDEQILKSENKIRVQKNVGIIVNTKPDLLVSYNNETSYIGMCVYVIQDKIHYKLIGNPVIESNWVEMYISTEQGGEIEAPIVIKKLRGRKDVFSLLQIEGFYNDNKIDRSVLKEAIPAISIGSRTLSTGLIAWTDESGNSYISNLNENPNSVLNVMTCGSTGNGNTPIRISNTCVAINSDIDKLYNTIIGGLTKFQNNIYTDSNISSEKFVSGFGGYGFKLGKDLYNRWELEIDNLRVRGRMDVYELVINQIRAQNGSLWITDGVKMEEVSKADSFGIFIKNTKVGKYKLVGSDYIRVPDDELPLYYKRLDAEQVVYYKTGLGHGDYRLSFNGTDFVYTEDSQTYYVKNDNGSFAVAAPTHRFDAVSKKYIPDVGGEYTQIDTVNLYNVTCNDLCPFVIGDLVRMQKWDATKNSISLAFGRVSDILLSSYEKSEFQVQVYENQELVKAAALVRTGNNSDSMIRSYSNPNDSTLRRTIDLTDKDMLMFISQAGFTVPVNDGLIRDKYPERQGAVYITSCDSKSPFIDVLDGMNTHNAFDPSQYPNRDVQVSKDRLKVRLGKLSGITDLEMGLLGGDEKIYGIYTDNGFFRGNLVAKSGKIGGYYLNKNAIFLFNDGIQNRLPSSFVRSNVNNLYVKEDGTGSDNPIDSGKINNVNINKMFANTHAGLLLDPDNDRLCFGNKLSYNNGVLVIGEVDGIGDLKTVINNMGQGIDTAFITELKNNFTVITGGLINSSVLRLGGITKDANGVITGWIDRAGMSGLDDAGENSVRFWAGSTLADRNTAPFRIYQNGSFVSEKGTIAGWTISDSGIYKNLNNIGIGLLSSYNSAGPSIYSGCTYSDFAKDKNNANFYVDENGEGKLSKWLFDGAKLLSERTVVINNTTYNTATLDGDNGSLIFKTDSQSSLSSITSGNITMTIDSNGIRNYSEEYDSNGSLLNSRTTLLNANGLLANGCNINTFPASTGIKSYASIVALGFGDLNKDIFNENGFVCGIYGDAINSGDAPYYGGYFNQLKVNGFIPGMKMLFTGDVDRFGNLGEVSGQPPYLLDKNVTMYILYSEKHLILPIDAQPSTTIYIKAMMNGGCSVFPPVNEEIRNWFVSVPKSIFLREGKSGIFTKTIVYINGIKKIIWVASVF